MGMLDPVWTESNWNTIQLRVYTVQSAAYDRLVLLGGIAITALAYLAIVFSRASIAKILKQDWICDSKIIFEELSTEELLWLESIDSHVRLGISSKDVELLELHPGHIGIS